MSRQAPAAPEGAASTEGAPLDSGVPAVYAPPMAVRIHRRHARATLSPTTSRATWMAARARNALRRWALAGTVGGLAFLVALIGLALVPRSATTRAQLLQARAGVAIDTTTLLAELMDATRASTAAEQAVAAARDVVRQRLARQAAMDSAGISETAVATTTPDARRDSLTLVASTLGQLLARVEAAPLPTSYRALGQSWALRGDPRIAALLDSLAALEREREGFDVAGSLDPTYIALTTRVNDVGRELTQIAARRRTEARAELAALAARAAPVALVTDDTTPRLADAAAARERLAEARGALARARAHNAVVARSTAEARRLANVAAPPLALLGASLVLGLVVGYGVALLVELRRPRLADAREAERMTGVRVLAVVEPQPAREERARRRTDLEAPPLLDPSFESYRTLYLQVAATGAAIPLVTVTGDEPEVAATIGTNLAAAAAFDARATLLVDGDPEHGLVARVLRTPLEPGLSAIIADEEEWARTIVSTPVGRSRYLDVIASGRPLRAPVDAESAERVRRDLARYAGRYDLAVLVAGPDLAEQGERSLLPSPDVVLCARTGHTPLRRLVDTVDALRGAGTRVRGVVVWSADPPDLNARRDDDDSRRAMSWTETRQAVAKRGSRSVAMRD